MNIITIMRKHFFHENINKVWGCKIINNIDVNNCPAYFPNITNTKDDCIAVGFHTKSQCNENPNCIYKQYQRTQIQYEQVVQQNKNLQSDLRRHQDAIDRIEEFTESIYEHIPEDRVLRQILNIVSEVKYAKKS